MLHFRKVNRSVNFALSRDALFTPERIFDWLTSPIHAEGDAIILYVLSESYDADFISSDN